MPLIDNCAFVSAGCDLLIAVARFEIHIVGLKIRVVWVVTLCNFISSPGCFEGLWCLYL